MKKVYSFLIFIAGMNSIIVGIYGLVDLNIEAIFETNLAYDYGNLLGKVVRVVFGLFLIKYVYDSYYNEKRNEVTD